MKKIVLFDGECQFCNKSVQFIIKRDPYNMFKFASLQSDIAKGLLKEREVPNNINSFILLENNQSYVKSSAALRVCKQLKGAWKLLYFLLIIPRPLRDFFYGLIAKNRHIFFKRENNCILPSPEDRKRFL